MAELKKYKVLRPIAIGGRVEAGETVELDAETAGSYAPGFLEEVEPTDAPAPSAEAGAETKTEDATPEVKKYSVVETITLDGVEHEAGAEIELTAEQLATLPEGSVTEVAV